MYFILHLVVPITTLGTNFEIKYDFLINTQETECIEMKYCSKRKKIARAVVMKIEISGFIYQIVRESGRFLIMGCPIVAKKKSFWDICSALKSP